MAGTISIEITDEQESFARSLVEAGRFPSLGAVVAHGLDRLREEDGVMPDIDTDALRALLDERRKGPFISIDEFDREAEKRFAEKRRAHGLSD